MGASQRVAGQLLRDILLGYHRELAGICVYHRVRVWAEICLYKQAGVQPTREPCISWLTWPGGLAPRCPGIGPCKQADRRNHGHKCNTQSFVAGKCL